MVKNVLFAEYSIMVLSILTGIGETGHIASNATKKKKQRIPKAELKRHAYTEMK